MNAGAAFYTSSAASHCFACSLPPPSCSPPAADRRRHRKNGRSARILLPMRFLSPPAGAPSMRSLRRAAPRRERSSAAPGCTTRLMFSFWRAKKPRTGLLRVIPCSSSISPISKGRNFTPSWERKCREVAAPRASVSSRPTLWSFTTRKTAFCTGPAAAPRRSSFPHTSETASLTGLTDVCFSPPTEAFYMKSRKTDDFLSHGLSLVNTGPSRRS